MYNPLDTLSQNVATAGQVLGLPEMNISERISPSSANNATNQTQPYTTASTGVFGQGGYVYSPITLNNGGSVQGAHTAKVVSRFYVPETGDYLVQVSIIGDTTSGSANQSWKFELSIQISVQKKPQNPPEEAIEK